MKITVKTKIPTLEFRDLCSGDCFFFVEDGIVDKANPYIKSDEGDCVNLSTGIYTHHDNIAGDVPVQKAKAELIIE